MDEIQKEAIETIEENLMTVFDTNFNQKHKPYILRIKRNTKSK